MSSVFRVSANLCMTCLFFFNVWNNTLFYFGLPLSLYSCLLSSQYAFFSLNSSSPISLDFLYTDYVKISSDHNQNQMNHYKKTSPQKRYQHLIVSFCPSPRWCYYLSVLKWLHMRWCYFWPMRFDDIRPCQISKEISGRHLRFWDSRNIMGIILLL